ncbi:MAG TPA: acyl-CoA dehydrogenase family protein [Dehalococcoidia bacterium]
MATYLELNKTLSEEESSIKDQAHRFAAEIMRPAAAELDRLTPEEVIASGSPLWEVFRRYRELGYHLRGMPEELGGIALSPLAGHIFGEEMGWGAADLSVSMGAGSMPFVFAARSGNPDLIASFVRPYIDDTVGKFVGCWAITEPQHGSDVGFLGNGDEPTPGFDVFAERQGDEWVIRGQKSSWVSNGTIASHAMVHMGVDRSKGMAGSAIAFVPLDLPGVTKGKPLDKLGQRALNQGEVFFDDVCIPADHILVVPQGYPMMFDFIVASANAGMGTTFTGLARAAFEEGLSYARDRVQGGKAICEHQAVQLKLMDMFIKVEAARGLSRAALVYNTTTIPPAPEYSIASKVFCTQASFEVASDALQLHGGYGLAKGMLIEKLFRDARAALIEDGTNDMLSLNGARRIIDRSS